jgi:hypothetical protein
MSTYVIVAFARSAGEDAPDATLARMVMSKSSGRSMNRSASSGLILF